MSRGKGDTGTRKSTLPEYRADKFSGFLGMGQFHNGKAFT